MYNVFISFLFCNSSFVISLSEAESVKTALLKKRKRISYTKLPHRNRNRGTYRTTIADVAH